MSENKIIDCYDNLFLYIAELYRSKDKEIERVPDKVYNELTETLNTVEQLCRKNHKQDVFEILKKATVCYLDWMVYQARLFGGDEQILLADKNYNVKTGDEYFFHELNDLLSRKNSINKETFLDALQIYYVFFSTGFLGFYKETDEKLKTYKNEVEKHLLPNLVSYSKDTKLSPSSDYIDKASLDWDIKPAIGLSIVICCCFVLCFIVGVNIMYNDATGEITKSINAIVARE